MGFPGACFLSPKTERTPHRRTSAIFLDSCISHFVQRGSVFGATLATSRRRLERRSGATGIPRIAAATYSPFYGIGSHMLAIDSSWLRCVVMANDHCWPRGDTHREPERVTAIRERRRSK